MSIVSPFAFITPGRPFSSSFSTPNGGKNWLMDLPLPCDQFAVSLLTAEVPAGHGFGVYWSVKPYSNWSYIGSLTVQNPTAFFSSPWASTNPLEAIDPALVAVAGPPQGIQIGVSLETLDALANLSNAEIKLPERSVGVDAVMIAKNLINYVSSLADVPPGLIKCLEKWAEKFNAKLARDPKFYLKNSD
jgi:hypothetical protein